jgi:UDP-N-acetylglucosamine 1-carboxyvinyltransferase
MKFFSINGGKKIEGNIEIQGSKNEAFMIINACLLTENETVIKNIPKILDIEILFDILKILNVEINFLEKNEVKINPKNLSIEKINDDIFIEKFKKIRGGISIIAPLLLKFEKITLHMPGGDKIGKRKLDTHIQGFIDFGAKVEYNFEKNFYQINFSNIKPSNIVLEEPSQTGTANMIMLASKLSGESTIYNAACEPNISQLCIFLKKMGVQIEGIGTNFLKIKGNKELKKADHEILPDILEIGSFIALSCVCESKLNIEKVCTKNLFPVLNFCKKLGIFFEIKDDNLILDSKKNFLEESKLINNSNLIELSDGPWPNFPPDLISSFLVASIFSNKKVIIHQKMYESRLFFVDNLISMGAEIILCDPHRVVVMGSKNKKLYSTNISSPDIRAGISLMSAAIGAHGNSKIFNIEQIYRGYENIEEKLKKIGVDIKLCEN